MEIETGEAASGARGLPGRLRKDSPAKVTTLFIASLGETYMVRKRTSSRHQTPPCFSTARQNTTKLTQDGCQAREAPNNRMWASWLFSPSSQRMWGADTQCSMSHQGGRCPTEGEGLPQGHPARSLSEQVAFLGPESRCLCPGKRLEQPGPGIFSETKGINHHHHPLKARNIPTTPPTTSLDIGRRRAGVRLWGGGGGRLANWQ